MKTDKLFLLIAAVGSLLAASCKTAFDLLLEGNDTDAQYEAAFAYYNEGKYNRATQLFEMLSVSLDNTERADTVQYYLAMSSYMGGDLYTAETQFNNYLFKYPRSPFVAEASFLRLDCLYYQTLRYELDQSPTYAAITAISEYMIEYPESQYYENCLAMLEDLNERLDKKALEAAKLYYNMEDYLASRVAFKNILKDDADNVYREDILYYSAMSSYKYASLSVPAKQRERYLVFIDDYLNFAGEYSESKYRRELDGLYRKAQKAIGRQVADEEEAAEE